MQVVGRGDSGMLENDTILSNKSVKSYHNGRTATVISYPFSHLLDYSTTTQTTISTEDEFEIAIRALSLRDVEGFSDDEESQPSDTLPNIFSDLSTLFSSVHGINLSLTSLGSLPQTTETATPTYIYPMKHYEKKYAKKYATVPSDVDKLAKYREQQQHAANNASDEHANLSLTNQTVSIDIEALENITVFPLNISVSTTKKVTASETTAKSDLTSTEPFSKSSLPREKFTTRRYFTSSDKPGFTTPIQTPNTSFIVANESTTQREHLIANGSSTIKSWPTTISANVTNEQMLTTRSTLQPMYQLSDDEEITNNTLRNLRFCVLSFDCDLLLNERCIQHEKFGLCGCQVGFYRHPQTKECLPKVIMRLVLKLTWPSNLNTGNYSSATLQNMHSFRQPIETIIKAFIPKSLWLQSIVGKVNLIGLRENNQIAVIDLYLHLDSTRTSSSTLIREAKYQTYTDLMKFIAIYNEINKRLVNFTTVYPTSLELIDVTGDINLCEITDMNYCSKQAICTHDTYFINCGCLEGFSDVSPLHVKYPGEICRIQCTDNYCHNGGYCHIVNDVQLYCSCQRWNVGNRCQFSSLVVISTFLVAVIIVLLIIALIMYHISQSKCVRGPPKQPTLTRQKQLSFGPLMKAYDEESHAFRVTIDTSRSSSRNEEHNHVVPVPTYANQSTFTGHISSNSTQNENRKLDALAERESRSEIRRPEPLFHALYPSTGTFSKPRTDIVRSPVTNEPIICIGNMDASYRSNSFSSYISRIPPGPPRDTRAESNNLSATYDRRSQRSNKSQVTWC